MNIAIFCSARTPFSEQDLDQMRQLCRALAKRGHGLVYGGASIGVMGLAADSFLQEGGKAIGVIPGNLFDAEIPHSNLTEFIETADLMERKKIMMERADLVLCLPGGLGTLDELFEVLTWKTLGCWQKPIILWNQNQFWDSLLQLIQDLNSKGVLGSEVMNSMRIESSIDGVLSAIDEESK